MNPPVLRKVEPAAKTPPEAPPRIAPGPGAPTVGPLTGEPRGPRRGRMRLVIAALVLLGVAVWGGHEIWQRFTHVYEYDARVTGNLVTVSSRVAGWLTELPVDDGTVLKKGDILARIDARASALRVEALEAQLKGIDADRARLLAQKGMVDQQTGARTRTREASTRSADAARGALVPQITLAQQELKRAEALAQRGFIATKQVELARATLDKLNGDMRKLDADMQMSQRGVEEARADRQQLNVIDTQLTQLTHRAKEVEAELMTQRVDLDDRTMRSPSDAVVDRTFVEVGQYVSVGQRILLLHDPGDQWVEANIKETAFRRVKIGQPVEVTVDAYPDKVFKGKVSSLGTSATSNFALLPTPNPSGNFTKITQRLPVRITLDPAPEPLSPGMMVEVNVDVRER